MQQYVKVFPGKYSLEMLYLNFLTDHNAMQLHRSIVPRTKGEPLNFDRVSLLMSLPHYCSLCIHDNVAAENRKVAAKLIYN